MNSHDPSKSFEAARRRHLIEATIEALADVGFKAASLSQIARRADVSTGLFAHYFGDKDGLLEATLRFMAGRLVQATRGRLRAARCPRERLYAVPDSALADTEFERRTSAVWLAFWGQITHSARYQRIQYIYQRRMLSNLKHDLRKLVAADRVETYAEMIAAMIDGVWIRSHASPAQREGNTARALVRSLIDGLIAPAGDGGAPLCPPAPAPATTGLRDTRTSVPPRPGEIAAARDAQRLWRDRDAESRAEALRAMARHIDANGGALARLEADITGQPVGKIVALSLARATAHLRRAAMELETWRPLRIEHAPGLYEHRLAPAAALVAIRIDHAAPLVSLLVPLAEALRDGHAAFLLPGAADDAGAAPGAALTEDIVALARAAGLPPALVQTLPIAADAEGLAPLRATPSARARRSATIVCEDADPHAAAECLARGLMPWAAGPDLGTTPIFVAARIQPRVEQALEEVLGRSPAGDPRDPATLIARSAVAGGEALWQAMSRGALRHRRCSNGDLFTCDRLPAGLHDAPGLLLAAYTDESDLLAQLSATGPWDVVGLLHAAPEPARRLANQIPAAACVGGQLDPVAAAFVRLALAAEGPAGPQTKRIFWGDSLVQAPDRPVLEQPNGALSIVS